MFGSTGLLVVCNTEVETRVFVDLEAAGRQKRVPPLPHPRPLTLGLLMLYEGLLFPSVLHLHQATSIFQIA